MIKFLSRFYPTFLHRLDRYLLLHYPLIWASKIHVLLFVGIILNLFILGLALILPASLSSMVNPLEGFGWLWLLSFGVGMIWLFSAHTFDPRKEFPRFSKGYEVMRAGIILLAFIVVCGFPMIYQTVLSSRISALVPDQKKYYDYSQTYNHGELNELTTYERNLEEYKMYVDPETKLTASEYKELSRTNPRKYEEMNSTANRHQWIVRECRSYMKDVSWILSGVFLAILSFSAIMVVLSTALSLFGTGQIIVLIINSILVSILFGISAAAVFSSPGADSEFARVIAMGFFFLVFGGVMFLMAMGSGTQSKGSAFLLNSVLVFLAYGLPLVLVGVFLSQTETYNYHGAYYRDFQTEAEQLAFYAERQAAEHYYFNVLVVVSTGIYFTVMPFLSRAFAKLYSQPYAG